MDIKNSLISTINKRHKYLFILVLISIALGVSLTLNDAKANTKYQKLIVQGASVESMQQSIEKVGGEVLHAFTVINAVSVELTSQQKEQLQQESPLLTFFNDATVELEDIPKLSKQDKLKFKVKKATVSWKVKLAKGASIDSIEAHWPAENGKLIAFTLNRKKLDVDTSNNSLYLQLPTKNTNTKNGQVEVQLNFETLKNTHHADYAIKLILSSGETVSFTPSQNKKVGKHRNTHVASHVRANAVHRLGYTGKGVTVAIIDSGLASFKQIKKNTENKKRNIYTFNVLNQSSDVTDEYGHGTHLSSIISNSSVASSGSQNPLLGFNGIAPNVDLLAIKAFDQHGLASYTDVLKAIDYVVANKDALNIKILNLSFSAQPSSFYWQDPINKALMVAWQSGITVIASAGNRGPNAQTIGVPGNNPYVLTVGAVSDNYTPNDYSDDFITSFSSAGPTIEGFIKPEITAPGGHIQGLINSSSSIAKNFSMFNVGADYYEISGTSQSTAVTTGIAALLLSKNPNLTPDQVKCQLVNSGKLMVTENFDLAYSIFQQGKGVVDALLALNLDSTNCVDNSESLALEITNQEHYLGQAEYNDETDTYFIEGYDALDWDGIYNDGNLWGRIRYVTSDGNLWGRIRHVEADGSLWGRIGDVATDGNLWGRIRHIESDGNLWGRIRHIGNDSSLWDQVIDTGNDTTNWDDIGYLESEGSLWGRIRHIETDESLRGRINIAELDGNLWGRIRGVGSDSDLWGQIGNIKFVGDLWGNVGDVTVDGNLWGRIKGIEMDGNLWGRIKTISNDGNLWGRIKTIETNGNLWGRIRHLENDGNLWGRIKDVKSGGNLWGRISTISNDNMNHENLKIKSNWVEQE